MIVQDTKYTPKNSGLPVARIVRAAVAVLFSIVLLVGIFKLWFSVNNHEIVALTYPTGKVEYFTTPGIYGQWFGHITSFEKRTRYDFEEPIQFTDGRTRPSRVAFSTRYRWTPCT